MLNEWVNVADVKMKCPVCGRPDWCLLSICGKKIICPRVKSNVVMGSAGYLHKVFDNGLCSDKVPRKRRSNRCVNWRSLARQYYRKGHRNPRRMEALSTELCLPIDNLRKKWGVGWDGDAYTIPAKNGAEELIGIMRRFPDGEKIWVSRSRNGLFIPKIKTWSGNLFICEGFSDAATLIELGFRALARSNCQTGLDYIKDLLHRKSGIGQVAIVGDNDPRNVHGNVGQRGATKLARQLYGGEYCVAVTDVPEKYKDMRQWIQQGGATKQDIIVRSRRL